MFGRGSTSNTIRGGQTAQHWSRMGFQVIRYAISVGIFTYTAVSLLVLVWYFDLMDIPDAFALFKAENAVQFGEPDSVIRYISRFDGIRNPIYDEMSATEMLVHPRFAELKELFKVIPDKLTYYPIVPALIAVLLALISFVYVGRSISKDTFIRGSKLVSQEKLREYCLLQWKIFKKKNPKSTKEASFSVAGLPFPPGALEAHTLVAGTVGSGKTTIILEILRDIRKLGGKAIVYDFTGEMVKLFYREGQDIIINPFDERSKNWTPLIDVINPAVISSIAEVLVPKSHSPDQFWTNAARLLLSDVLTALFESHGREVKNSQIKEAIASLSDEELSKIIEKKMSHTIVAGDAKKTTASIRATLLTELKFLHHLHDDGEPFSVREWMREDDVTDQFIFLSTDAELSASTRGFHSAFLEVASNALMTCPRTDRPRCFFIVDELPTLNRIPFIIQSLGTVRQKGGAWLLGFQVFSQLEDLYGHDAAHTISGVVNTRILFNTPDPETARHFSASLGEEDTLQMDTSLSMGAEQSRDGSTNSFNRVTRPIISESEFLTLPQLVAAIRFSYGSPTALIDVTGGYFDPLFTSSKRFLGEWVTESLFKTVPRVFDLKPIAEGYIPRVQAEPKTPNINGFGSHIDPKPKLLDQYSSEQQFTLFSAYLGRCYPNVEIDRQNPSCHVLELWHHFSTNLALGISADEIDLLTTSLNMMDIGSQVVVVPFPKNHNGVTPIQESHPIGVSTNLTPTPINLASPIDVEFVAMDVTDSPSVDVKFPSQTVQIPRDLKKRLLGI